MKKILQFLLLLNLSILFSQVDINYDIEGKLNEKDGQIDINQNIFFKNISDNPIETIYMNDWSNSYSSTDTPLAKRFGEEYDRSFYLSSKNKLGFTKIDYIKKDGDKINWNRLSDQKDIIRIVLNRPLKKNDSLNIDIKYSVKLPDSKFTGYGNKNGETFHLKHWYISISPFHNGKWKKYSNLDLDDSSINKANYKLSLDVLKDLTVNTNLDSVEKKLINNQRVIRDYQGKNKKEIELVIGYKNNFKTIIDNEGRSIITDIYTKNLNEKDLNENIFQIIDFVNSFLETENDKTTLVSKIVYEKNPYYGLNDLPSFLRPFSDDFLNEITFLKVYLHYFLSSKLTIDLRENHWILTGLQTYIIIKYIEKFHPDQKFLGRISSLGIMKLYNISTVDFNDSFLLYSEFVKRANLQQADITSKNELTRFNERIASPYHIGLGFRYLEEYVGENVFKKGIRKFLKDPLNKSFRGSIVSNTKEDLNWFFDDYLGKRESFDLSIEKLEIKENNITIEVLNKKGSIIPYTVGQLRNDSLVDLRWINPKNNTTKITLEYLDSDYISVNPSLRFPEINRSNNWRYLKRKIKPIQFNFFKDYESPKREQIYYNPIMNYNYYDGFSLGSRFHNKGIKMQKFTFELMPEYSTNQETIVGLIKGQLNLFNEKSKNYRTQINLYASSYHYKLNSRYRVIVPGISTFIRTPEFRSNKGQAFSLFYYSVFRENLNDSEINPNYNILSAKYLYSNKTAIKHFTIKSNFETSKGFGKIDFTTDYRKLFPSGRQISGRLFIGKFLWHNRTDSSYFDYNLNRPTDYLFNYNYFGRSEEQGVFSQQFVMAEGGFKSKFETSSANDYIISTNFTVGLWKFVELYSDLGVIKNLGSSSKGFFDSGIGLNFIPDYLQLYFPFYSSNGWQINGKSYEEKIRFVLSIDPDQLMSLFSRRWF